ncbi:MAG: zinc ABC transporter substrate-binding protein [Chloroflexi bacterium RBG_13_48_17]|nr:MAG: zinc ABC transporter substrate-binding protein [Chloroflexi bacterium RBG_13_48_17]
MSSKYGSVFFSLLIIFVLAASALSCGQEEMSDKIGVVVTLQPQAEFVENVGGEMVKINVMVPPGASPHTYEPTPGQMTEAAKAKMYAKVGSGVEFELTYMDKIAAVNKNMLVVDCSKGIHLTASEDPDEPGMDPHIWVSPRNAQIMVQNICAGLIQVDPENKAYYEMNRDTYLDKLDELDIEISDKLANIQNRAFIVLHPSWGYFARDYNLEQIAIEVGGKEPSAQDIARIIEEAKKRNIKVIFASPQFNPQSAKVIAKEIDGRVILIDNLARDYIANLQAVLNELSQAME